MLATKDAEFVNSGYVRLYWLSVKWTFAVDKLLNQLELDGRHLNLAL